MNVSVFGLGYVGCVTAACLAHEGHHVIGVDLDGHKVRSVNSGKCPFYEPGVAELLEQATADGLVHATTNETEAIAESELAMICVGTPSNGHGCVRLDYLRAVFATIGKALRFKNRYFVVALRSTVLPACLDSVLIPMLSKESGKRTGKQIGFVCNPEFLREGSAVDDFYNPPWTLIGADDENAASVVAELYANLDAPVISTDPRTALMIKYASNAYHGLKVVFANEMGQLASSMGVDGAELMKLVCQDRKLNVSAKYLRPGLPFGGSCLPKDIRALLAHSRSQHIHVPVLDSILESNEVHLRNCVRAIVETGKKKVGFVGLTFKAGTDDLRESPAVEMAELLIGKGFELVIREPAIAPGSVYGSNLAAVERAIPHIWKLLSNDLDALVRSCEVIAIMHPLSPAEKEALRVLRPGQVCLDFVGALQDNELPNCECRSVGQLWAEDEPALAA